MFYGYSIDRWVGLLQYFCIVFALGTGVCFISAKATYMCFRDKKKVSRINVSVNKRAVKKQVFFDVA